MGTIRVGRLWHKGKCLTKKDIWLNGLKYTNHEIEDYECKIDDKNKDAIMKEIKGEYCSEEQFYPSIVFVKYSNISKMRSDTYKDILKTREEIARLSGQIPLAKNVEVMERLEEEMHYKQAYIGDIEDSDFDGDTLESDIKIIDYVLNIIEYVAEQEDIQEEDIIMTIETS